MNRRTAMICALSLLAAACSAGGEAGESADDLGSVQEAEKWSTSDEPGILSSQLSRNIGNLPMQGQANPVPWPSSYWRMAQDSINYRWGGQNVPSAVEKYDSAFGGYRGTDYVSASFG